MKVTRLIEHIEEFHLSFSDKYGAGYGFDCTPDGQITGSWWSSLNYAIAGYCEGEYTISIQDYSRDLRSYGGVCDCGEDLLAYGGYDEFECEKCGAEYNIFGQRLRSDWRNNRSNWDDEVDDMTGYELAYAGDS